MKTWWLNLRCDFWLWLYGWNLPLRRLVCRVFKHDYRWVFYKGRRCHRCEWVEARP